MGDLHELMKGKSQCIADLTDALPMYRDRLNSIDTRLIAYIDDAISGDGSHANLYELLGIRKELRLMDSYEVSAQRVQKVIRAIEGVWKNGRHVIGGLKFDTPRGNMNVRLMPYQAWCIFGIYGFTTEADMERPYVDGDALLPTEFVKDGKVWNRRRLTVECHLFQTRKSGKTEFGAAIDFIEACFTGPMNAQSLVCANSREQAKIAYKAIKQFAAQVDPSCLNRMGGKFFRLTSDEMNWQPEFSRTGEIKVMSAGGKRKDGLYASVVHADEHGSASYVNGNSDMQSLVEVCWGSTGPRREKLLMHTTTAGLVHDGPYKNQLDQVQKILLSELEHPLGIPVRTDDDKWFAFLLQLDPWEMSYELDRLDDNELFRKVNRSIGVTVQPTYYRERIHDARLNEDTLKEVLTKDFNIWQTSRITAWECTADDVRRIQRPMRITDCLYRDGWSVFVGLDFSGGDDLCAVSYFAVNYAPGLEMKDRFFADCEVWVVESDMQKSPNRPLYELWKRQGWLYVCPGDVFNPDLAINQLMAKNEAGVNLRMFGYDPAQSKHPINTLKAWLQSLGLKSDVIKSMVVPVSQSFMTMNGVIDQLKTYINPRGFCSPIVRCGRGCSGTLRSSQAATIPCAR